MRLENFVKNDDFIDMWNANKENTSKVGHNFLSDWTTDEIKKLNSAIRDENEPDEPLHKFVEN